MGEVSLLLFISFFLAAAASGILCIFLVVTACLSYLDVEVHLLPSWWTFFQTNRDTFYNGALWHTSIYKTLCAVLETSSEMLIRHSKCE